MLLGLCLLAAVLVLWAGPALAQTATVTHTGSATVKDGKVQLVEGGASTTLQVSLSSNFISDLKTTRPEAARTGAVLGSILAISRSSTAVTWTTGGTAFSDRTDEFEISYGGTALDTRQNDAQTIGATTIPERLWFFLPLDTANSNGQTSQYKAVDDFPDNSFPNTFTIEAKTDTTYLEEESITIRVWFVLVGNNADPAFSTILIPSNELTFDLVEGAFPDPTDKPTTPTNLTAVAGKGAVTLTWDAVDATSSNTNLVNDVQITKHEFRQSTDGDISDETWTDIPNSGYGEVNATTYTIGSLTDGTEYTFQVRAVNACTTTTGCGESDPATVTMVTPNADALSAPTGLMATAGNTQITLDWTDPGDAAILYYEYQQKEGSAAFGPWTEISGSSATTTSYRLTGLSNGRPYSYRIRARTSVETGPASDAVTATPRGVPPAVPVLTATPRNGGVTLSWPNPVDDSLLRYDYQYKIGTGVYQPWRTGREVTEEDCEGRSDSFCRPPYLRTSGATLQFPVGGLTNGTPHTFRIRAVNPDGTTTSNEVTATPVAGVPAKPTGLTTRLSTSRIRVLEWDRVADPSILRYEFTTDEGRTWSLLLSGASVSSRSLPEGQFLSGYTFRIRAVNAAGPGPASDPAVEEETATVVTKVSVFSASLEWDATTMKATLVWDQTEHAHLRWWSIYFGISSNECG